ncbi:MAG: terminase [Rhodospirillaceae bacterium]|nr:MAG: terminase [Rhodospirillaceae bacterium]
MSSDQKTIEAICRQSLYSFIVKMFEIYNEGATFKENGHIKAIAWKLQQCAEGKSTRFICTLPPRNLKSFCASIAFPAWLLGRDPRQKIICVSYNDDLATDMSLARKKLMESDEYRKIFPNTLLKGKNTETIITTSKGGRCIATSVNGTLTGRGGNFIIIDDPIKPAGATSDSELKKIQEWYGHTLFSRLDDKINGVIALIMQRLHRDDLAGHLLRNGEWAHLNLPAIATSDETIQIGENEWYSRKQGEALHPNFENLDKLEEAKQNLGSYCFSAQYQQDPAPALGGMIKEEYFRFYDEAPIREFGDRIVLSVDPASTLSKDASYSVITIWLVKGHRYFLINLFRDRVIPHNLKMEIKNGLAKWRDSIILIEDHGIGIGICADIKYLYRTNPRRVVGVKIAPGESKVIRMETELYHFIEGRVFFPRKAPYLNDLTDELLTFPNGKHDDQVDSISQFLKMVGGLSSGSSGGSGGSGPPFRKLTLRDASRINRNGANGIARRITRKR